MERVDVKNREKITKLFQLIEMAEEKQLISSDEKKDLIEETRRPRTLEEIISYYSWEITEEFEKLLKYKHEDLEKYDRYFNRLVNLAGMLGIEVNDKDFYNRDFHERLKEIYDKINSEYTKGFTYNITKNSLNKRFNEVIHGLVETVMEGNTAKISYVVHGSERTGLKSREENDWKIDRKKFFGHLVSGEVPIYKKLLVASDEYVLTEEGRGRIVKNQLVERIVPIANMQSINGDDKIGRIIEGWKDFYKNNC